MSQSTTDAKRRTLLKLALSSAAAVPLSSLVLSRQAAAEDLPPVSEDDPAAVGLSYVHDASKSDNPKYKPDQFCKNCNLVRSDSGEWRACAIFPGKGVNENGWCSAWVLKS
jgi:hypothetical protein